MPHVTGRESARNVKTDKVAEAKASLRDMVIACHDDRVEEMTAACGSPIEKLLLLAMLQYENYSPRWPDWFMGKIPPCHPGQPDSLHGIIQAPVGRYRADFAIIDYRDKRMAVIECDGHDFHERTKKQAAHDRSRDRWMTGIGIHVFRFTGSEIYNDAEACASEIFEWISI